MGQRVRRRHHTSRGGRCNGHGHAANGGALPHVGLHLPPGLPRHATHVDTDPGVHGHGQPPVWRHRLRRAHGALPATQRAGGRVHRVHRQRDVPWRRSSQSGAAQLPRPHWDSRQADRRWNHVKWFHHCRSRGQGNAGHLRVRRERPSVDRELCRWTVLSFHWGKRTRKSRKPKKNKKKQKQKKNFVLVQIFFLIIYNSKKNLFVFCFFLFFFVFLGYFNLYFFIYLWI